MIIKVCGMRDADNITAVEQLGADLIGLIFYPKSPRFVSTIPAVEGEKRAKRVGVFVNSTIPDIIGRIADYSLDYIQLHGNESNDYIRTLREELQHSQHANVKIIKAISVAGIDDIALTKRYHNAVDLFLFDTKCDTMGGSGRQFTWDVLNSYSLQTPFLLSGGIGPDDIRQVMEFNHPQMIGVDLNSRFELSPAVKDVDALSRFIHTLRQQTITKEP